VEAGHGRRTAATAGSVDQNWIDHARPSRDNAVIATSGAYRSSSLRQ
jgi:hypothetical protein